MQFRKKPLLVIVLIISMLFNSGFDPNSNVALAETILSGYDHLGLENIDVVVTPPALEIALAPPLLNITTPSALNVVFPEAMPFMIDPLGLKSDKEIYSDEFTVYNYSDKDVIVRLSALCYTLISSDDFDTKNIDVFIRVTFLDEQGDTQVIDIPVADIEQSDVPSFVLKASTYDESGLWSSFNEGSTMKLEITGSINPMAGLLKPIDWEGLSLEFNVNFSTEEW